MSVKTNWIQLSLLFTAGILLGACSSIHSTPAPASGSPDFETESARQTWFWNASARADAFRVHASTPCCVSCVDPGVFESENARATWFWDQARDCRYRIAQATNAVPDRFVFDNESVQETLSSR